MKIRVLLICAAMFTLAACSLADDVTPPPALATQQAAQLPIQSGADRPPAAAQPASGEPAAPGTEPDPQAGAVLYADRCAPCHGPGGLGDGSMASNLEIPPTRLGDPEVAAQASPQAWYAVVTQGRMDRFMPPFSSLSDQQRWDVVAYALSLSASLEQLEEGGRLYAESCAECHAADGSGSNAGPALDSTERYAGQSIASMETVIRDGARGMPPFADTYDAVQRIALAQFVRSLSFASGSGSEAPPSSVEGELPSASASDPIATGAIAGRVTNGTPGGTLPDGLEVTIVGFDGETPAFNWSVPVVSEGRYSVDGVEIVSGRIYGAIVEYEGVPYYSSAGHLLSDAPSLELPLRIFESTPDTGAVQVDRLHVIFDFSIEGIVEVSQLWLVTNAGDETVAQVGGQNAIPVDLPEGASNLQFADPAADTLYTRTETGFVMHEPIRPDSAVELIFSFSLPYTNRLTYEQRLTLPVQAVVLLTEEDAPDLQGDQVVLTGEQPMGGVTLRTYARAGLEPGETLSLSISGRSASAAAGTPSTNLIIGLGVFAVALIVTGLGLLRWRRQDGIPVAPSGGRLEGEREHLLYALAALDASYEAGEIEEVDYRARRTMLKDELAALMRAQDD